MGVIASVQCVADWRFVVGNPRHFNVSKQSMGCAVVLASANQFGRIQSLHECCDGLVGLHAATKSTFISGWYEMQKLLYARLEAAQAVSISLRKIDELISTRSLKTVRVGKRNMVTRAELERFARSGTRTNR